MSDPRPEIVSHVSYLQPLILTPDKAVEDFKRVIAGVKFDTLIGTGLSGTLSVPLFARAVGCRFAIVRKRTDNTHSVNDIEGVVGKRWVFVDDLVCTGNTRERVKEAMKNFCEQFAWESVYVGDYLFYDPRFKATGFMPYGEDEV